MKVILPQDQITNFSIDVVSQYEGCAPALKMLRKIYKDQIKHFSDTKEDFQELAKHKPIWIIQFLMNIVSYEDRVRFAMSEIDFFLKKLHWEKDWENSDLLDITHHMVNRLKYDSKQVGNDQHLLELLDLNKRYTEINHQLEGITNQAVPKPTENYLNKLSIEHHVIKAALKTCPKFRGKINRFTHSTSLITEEISMATHHLGLLKIDDQITNPNDYIQQHYKTQRALKVIRKIDLWQKTKA